jgi:hypothetical protein
LIRPHMDSVAVERQSMKDTIMSKYLNQSDDNDQRQPTPTQAVSPTKARQGRLGRPVLLVLICGLVLAMVVWFFVEMWGRAGEYDSKTTASTTGKTTDVEPSGPRAFDNNPAKGPQRPPEAIDRNPRPTNNGG